jgi:hypothetical protein
MIAAGRGCPGRDAHRTRAEGGAPCST